MLCTGTTQSNAKGPAPPRLTGAWLIAGLLLWGAGCEGLGVRSAPVDEPPDTAEGPAAAADARQDAAAPAGPAPKPAPELTPEEADEVERLLYQAERAIADDHLTYPSKGSALALYDRVRILDPDNDEARRGLERIVERYLELALQAADQRRFTNARAMLDRARLVDPRHPGITPTTYQVQMLAGADRKVISLDEKRLRDHDPDLQATLRQAGIASRGDGCRAQITARSDSEGRWIYQQMSAAPGDRRITAELDIGSPPRIEVLCFPESP